MAARPGLSIPAEAFDLIVDSRVGHVIAAGEVQNVRARVDAAVEQKRAAIAGKEAARKFIRKTGERLAGV